MKLFNAHLQSFLREQVALFITKEIQEQGERAINVKEEPGPASKQSVTSGSGC